MLQTVKSSFLILVIFSMFSTVYAADNNEGTKQLETIIHKDGVVVKSTRIYEGVPSRQYMDTQGKSIEEIKGPDMSTQETPADELLYRGAPISTWTIEDYINVTPQKFHNALRNQTAPSNKSYQPKLTVVPGDETNSEQRTAPISTWSIQDYLNVTPQSKHRAINEMQKAPTVTPGEITDIAPRTRPISEFSKEDYLKVSPPSLHDAINNEGGTFTVGSSRSYDEITITLSTDNYPSESSWNLYDSTAGAFYYTNADSSVNNQTFTTNYETQTVTLELQPGAYAVVTYDSYGDGGMTGTVADENDIVLVTISHTGWANYSDTWAFTVSPPTYDVTINLSTDNYPSESSWQLFDDNSAAVTTLQTFSNSYETQTMTVALEGGSYELITYDSYGDGGMTGTVSDVDGNTLATINHTGWANYSDSWAFAIGLYDVTVVLEADGYASESSWNLYGPYNDTTESAYYYTSNQTFTANYETQTTVFSLAAGDYSVDLWDSYGDGGMSGTVTDADGNLLITIIQPGSWFSSVYSSSHPFEVVVPEPVSTDLFFSEYIEGSSYSKALEVYNPTEDTLSLDNYLLYSAGNGGDLSDFLTFPAGATLAPGGVFVLANEDADSLVLRAADTTFNYGSANAYMTDFNGDDTRALAKIKDGDTTFIDVIGDYDFANDSGYGDPGQGYDVAGVTDATKNHTLVRKPDITMGNIDWTASAGDSAGNSEWIVFDQNHFDNIGGHPDDPCWGSALTFVFNTGSYGSEVQYYMTGPAGDTLFSCFGCHASGQTPAATETLCLDDGVYTLWGRDSYGDTWNGGNYSVTDADGNVVASGTGPPSGSTEWHTYTLGVNVGVASGSQVNYDGLVLNDSETVEMMVVNTGFGAGATMTLDSVSTSGASFSASATGLPDTIAAGASISVSVTYTPTTEGDHEGYVILTHSGPGSPDSVMVSGFGVDGFFYEGFDPHAGSATDFSTLPMDGWTILDNNNDADSIPQRYRTWYHDDYGVGSSGNMVAYYGFSSDYDADEQMITPVIHTPDLAKLSFKTYDYDTYLGVGYSVDGTTFMDLADVYVNGYWQQHDLSLPAVDSLWLEFTFDPDSGYSPYSTNMNIDEVKVVSLPNTYMDGWVYDQNTDLGVGNVSVMLNNSEVTTTGENVLYLDPGFEDSSFVSTYLTPAASDWWAFSFGITPTALTNFAHMTDGDSIYVDTSAAFGTNELSVHEGVRALKMWGQSSGLLNYTAIYKEIGAVNEGQEMYVGAWAMSHRDGPLTGGTAFFVAINWLDAGFAIIEQDQGEWMDSTYIEEEVGWNEWHYMDVHGVAPAGVAHVQLQLTFYQPAGYATGSVYVDAAQATMHPGRYNYRGMDEGDYAVMYTHDDYNSGSFAGISIVDDVADTTRLDAGLAPKNLTEFEAGFEADQDSGSTVITSGSASFMVMDSLRLALVDSTVFTDTTSTGADTTWTVYDTTEINVDPYAGDGMLVYGPTGSQGSVYEDSAYAMWSSGETIDITPYMAEGGNLSMYYRRNMDVASGDYFYVGVMTDDSTVWWGDYNNHTGTTYGGWYYQSADLTWLRELSSDSVTTVTPIIIFESNDTIVSGWGGAFDDFNVDGNPWFLPTPGKLHSESFQSTYVPLHWEDPISSGRVTYEVRHFNLSDLGNMQLPREYDSFTVSSDFDNSAMSRDAVSFAIHRRHWDGSENGMIGEWEPLAVTTGNSYYDFSLEPSDRADYHITVRYEDGDSPIQSNHTHAAVDFPYVMLADSFGVETFSDSVMPDYWSRWSSTGTSSFEVGDSASFAGNTGETNSLGNYDIPEHPDSAGTFAAVNNPREQGTTVLFSPYLDFSDHQSVVLHLNAWAMTYYDYYPQDYAYGDGAAVYVRSQSNDWHLAVALNYRHTDDIYPYTNPDGWTPERADLGWLLGGEDRVQFKIEWRHGTNTYSYGNGLAIDDFSVSALEGPSGLMASSSTDSVLLEWMGAGGGGRSVPLDPNWTPLSHEEKMLLIEQNAPNFDEEIVSDELSFGDRHNIVSPEVTVSQNNRPSSTRQGGDTFADAVAITLPYTGSGTTVGYTHDYGPYNDGTNLLCGVALSSSVGLAGDVVYKLTLADTMEIVVDLDNSLYDTALGVYDSLGTDSVALVLANDDYNGLQSYVQCHLPPGTYYIVVDGYSTSTGAYEIAVYQIIPPDIGAQLQTVWKDGMIIADELPDSVFSYTDHNVSLNESCYSISARELMWVSPEFVPYMMVEGPVGDWVGSDHSNIECAAMVNTPPGAFALVTPPDGQSVEITHDNIGSNQVFAWSQSVDPNGSIVTYHATLQLPAGADTLEISVDTTGTTLLVSNMDIAEVMTVYALATGNYTADVSWTVYADDGWDVIEASNGPRSVSIDVGWYLGMNDEAIIPDVFALHQNYPNPFNPVTTIRYDIPEQALVRIDIYNILGQKVAVLAEGFHEPGFHAVTWNGTNMYGNALSSGMYFYHINAGDFRDVKKLLLVK